MSYHRSAIVTSTLLSAFLGVNCFGAEFNTVALSGEAANVGSATFTMFDDVDLNNQGQMVFQAVADDDALDTSKTYANFYVDAVGSRRLIDHDTNSYDWEVSNSRGSSDALPIFRSQINDNGHIGYVKLTEQWSSTEASIHTKSSFQVMRTSANNAAIQTVAKSGDLSPYRDGDSNTYLINQHAIGDYFKLLSNGDVIFSSTVRNGENTVAPVVMRTDGQSITKIMAEGDAAAANGLPGNIGIFVNSPAEPYLFSANDDGDMLFAHSFPKSSTVTGFTANATMFDQATGGIQAITRTGDAAPQYTAGTYFMGGFNGYLAPIINNNQTMFLRLTCSSDSIFRSDSIYMYKNKELKLIAAGHMGFDLGFETPLWYISGALAYNNQDKVLIRAKESFSSSGIYLGSEDGLITLANSESVVTEINGVDYYYTNVAKDGIWHDQEHVQLNDNDIIACIMTLKNEADEELDALLTRTIEGEWKLLAYEGMNFDVMQNNTLETRTISSLDLDLMDLNNQNLLAFGMSFTDGSSGIFTTMIPEPASGLVLLGAMGLLGFKRRSA